MGGNYELQRAGLDGASLAGLAADTRRQAGLVLEMICSVVRSILLSPVGSSDRTGRLEGRSNLDPTDLSVLKYAPGTRPGNAQAILSRAANGFGLLVLVVAILRLELLDQRDVLLLSCLGGEPVVNKLLPSALLCFALMIARIASVKGLRSRLIRLVPSSQTCRAQGPWRCLHR